MSEVPALEAFCDISIMVSPLAPLVIHCYLPGAAREG
jgi:hypothetical protein